jgi:hypothetical protein
VQLLVVSGGVGLNQVHVTIYAPDGNTANVTAFKATLQPPSGAASPISLSAERVAANHFLAPAARIPTPGDWQLTLTMRVRETDPDRGTTAVPEQDVKTAVIVPVA